MINDGNSIFSLIDCSLDGDRIYLFNKLNVLVTSLVRNHLETDNARVAIVKDGRVIGIGPGKTNVRVRSYHRAISRHGLSCSFLPLDLFVHQ